MRTAEDHLNEAYYTIKKNQSSEHNDVDHVLIKAMKAYTQQVAEQVRQECADNAFKIYKDNGMTNLAERAKQSILSTPIELI